MKSSKPNQNKPNQHHKGARSGNPKITKQSPSNPDGAKRKGNQNIQSVMQPTRTNNTTSMVRASSDQHTPKGMNSHTNQPNNKIIGTLSSSHTTHAHPNTPQSPGPVQSGLSDPTHTHTTNKIAVNADSSERIYQRSFSYRHLTKTQSQSDCLAGRCRSR